jgi:hypothetical protein
VDDFGTLPIRTFLVVLQDAGKEQPPPSASLGLCLVTSACGGLGGGVEGGRGGQRLWMPRRPWGGREGAKGFSYFFQTKH